MPSFPGVIAPLEELWVSWVMMRASTEPSFTSEPVASNVSSAQNVQRLGDVAAVLFQNRPGSPSNSAAAATNWVPSMTEPPPTASRKLILSRRTSPTPVPPLLKAIVPNAIL